MCLCVCLYPYSDIVATWVHTSTCMLLSIYIHVHNLTLLNSHTVSNVLDLLWPPGVKWRRVWLG